MYKKVYRLENDKGNTPYKASVYGTSETIWEYFGNRNIHNSREHPSLEEDLPYENGESDCSFNIRKKRYKSGCNSVSQLKRWFGRYFNDLVNKFGFNVIEVTVVDYVEGVSGKQVFYKECDVVEKQIARKHKTS